MRNVKYYNYTMCITHTGLMSNNNSQEIRRLKKKNRYTLEVCGFISIVCIIIYHSFNSPGIIYIVFIFVFPNQNVINITRRNLQKNEHWPRFLELSASYDPRELSSRLFSFSNSTRRVGIWLFSYCTTTLNRFWAWNGTGKNILKRTQHVRRVFLSR